MGSIFTRNSIKPEEENNFSRIIFAGYHVSHTFSNPSIKRLFAEVLNYYKDTFVTKQSNFFNDCLVLMLRDFELCPFLVPLKDCFVIYSLITESQASQNKFSISKLNAPPTATTTLSGNININQSSIGTGYSSFSPENLAQIFQIIADYYLPNTTIGEELLS